MGGIADIGEQLTGCIQIGLQPLTVLKSERRCLKHVAGVVLSDDAGAAHLVLRRDHHSGMTADTRSKVKRSEIFTLITSNFPAQLFLGQGKIPEPTRQFCSCPYPRQINITFTVTEPTTHLHQRVKVFSPADVETNKQ